MKTRTEAFAHFLKKVSDAYVKDQERKGIRASGRSAASLRSVTDPAGGKLFGKSYFHFQKVGRRPGKWPPKENIRNWILEKGIIPERGTLEQLIYLFRRKIANLGTDIFLRRRPGLSVEDEVLAARKELAQNIARIAKEQIVEKLKSQRV